MNAVEERKRKEQRQLEQSVQKLIEREMTGKTLGEIVNLLKALHPWPIELNGLTKRVYEDKRTTSEVRVITWALEGLSVRVWLGEDLDPYRIVSKAWVDQRGNMPTGRIEILCPKVNE